MADRQIMSKDFDEAFMDYVKNIVRSELLKGGYLKSFKIVVTAADATTVTGYELHDEVINTQVYTSKLAVVPSVDDIVLLIEIDGKTDAFAAFK